MRQKNQKQNLIILITSKIRNQAWLSKYENHIRTFFSNPKHLKYLKSELDTKDANYIIFKKVYTVLIFYFFNFI